MERRIETKDLPFHAYTHMKELQKASVDSLRYNKHRGVFPVKKVMAGTDLISELKF